MPATVGVFLLAGAGIGETAALGLTFAGISLAQAVGTTAIVGTFIGLRYAASGLLPTQSSLPEQSSGGSQSLRQPIPERVGGYGRTRPQGYYVCYEIKGYASVNVVAFLTGRIEGFYQHYLHDNAITVNETTGLVVTVADTGFYQYNQQGAVRVRTRIGLPTETAYDNIIDLIPALWTDDHRGDGIASLAYSCGDVPINHFNEVYPDGLPVPRPVIDCYLVYDFRDEAQDIDDEETWQWGTNPFVCLADYLTNVNHGGIGLSYGDVIAPNLDKWIEEANICDEEMARKSGTPEPRYTCNGWYKWTTNPESTIGSILATCDGWIVEDIDGSLIPIAGKYREPPESAVIADRHVVAFAPSFGQYEEEAANTMAIKYVSPEHSWTEVDGEAWRDEDAITADGQEISASLDLTWVQSFSQARRLAKRAMYRQAAARWRATITVSLYGLTLIGRRWIWLDITAFPGFSGVVGEIVADPKIDLAAMQITFEVVVIDPLELEAWDPETEEGDPPPIVVKRNGGTQVLKPLHVAAEVVTGTTIAVTWDFSYVSPAAGVAYVVWWRVHPAGSWTVISSLTITNPEWWTYRTEIDPGLSPGNYDFIVVASADGGSARQSDPVTLTIT